MSPALRGVTDLPRLHVVTDDPILAREGWPAHARAVMEALGARVALHVRGPGTDGATLFALTAELLAEARRSGARLVVNDRVDVALAAGATRVHLGERSLPARAARRLLGEGCRVGVSVHAVAAVPVAVAAGADYVFLGALLPTPSHAGRPGLGFDALARAVAGAGETPLVGIGGIALEHAGAVVGTGAHGVAVVRGVWDAPEPAAAALAYVRALEEALHG